MKNLEQKIKEAKAGRTMAELKREDKRLYYIVKRMVAELSEKKAEANGNFITKDDLTEYRNLIIWNLKRTNYKGYLNMKEAMEAILKKIENENVLFITKRGIKGIVTRMAFVAGLENTEANLRAANGFTVLTNTYGNRILEAFEQFKLNLLMN